MRPQPTAQRTAIFMEALGLACSIGLLHAVAEATLLGLNGVRPSALDLAIFLAAYVGGGVVLAVVMALTAMTPPLRAFLQAAGGPLVWRRVCWTILIAGYVVVFSRILYYWSGWGMLLWLLAAAPGLTLAALAVYRKGQRALVAVSGSAMVASTLCALQFAHAEWDQDFASPGAFAARLLIPVGVCLVALIAAMRTTSPDAPFEPVTRSFGPLAILVAAWAIFWVGIGADLPFGRLSGDAPVAERTSRPNFLLIVLDTVRADHLDLFGYERETMPNLRRFAQQESQFAGPMLTTSPWTLPSHASMFTGLYASAHGAHHPFVHDETPEPRVSGLDESTVTLAELLDGLGYQTSGIVANFGPLSGFGLRQGFAEYDVAFGPARRATELLWFYRLHVGALPTVGQVVSSGLPDTLQPHSLLLGLREPPYRRAWEITDEALQWLDHNSDRPFFLFLNYFDAHAPYLPQPQDDERFAPRPAGEEWRGFPTERYEARIRGQGEFTDAEKAFLAGQYDAELVGLDREFGRLVESLKERGVFENTVILVTTDHGESHFEHGLIDHATSLYQHQVGGFLLLKTPPSLGTIAPSPRMQFVDFLPTILTILGEPLPPEVQGSPWGVGRDYMLSELFSKPGAVREPDQWPEFFRNDRIAVVIGDQKLIRSTNAPDEVYDLAVDPAELHPLADPDPEFMRRAEEVIAARNERLVEGLSVDPDDPKLLERLRSLGYIQ